MSKGLFGRVQNELDAREKTPGLTMADILDLPDTLRNLVNWMMRQDRVGLAQVAAYLSQSEAAAKSTLKALVDKGFVREIEIKGQLEYSIRLAMKKKRDLPSNLWKALDVKLEEETEK